jgi:hypothetical protein
LQTLGSGRRKELLRRPFLGDDTLIEEDNMVGHFTGKLHLVRDKDHGHPFASQAAQRPKHFADQLGVQRRHHLIEKHVGGAHRKRTRDPQPLLLPAGQGGGVNSAGFAGGSNSRSTLSKMSKIANEFSPDVGERAVLLILDHKRQHGSR